MCYYMLSSQEIRSKREKVRVNQKDSETLPRVARECEREFVNVPPHLLSTRNTKRESEPGGLRSFQRVEERE
jgi:hypothetical protein